MREAYTILDFVLRNSKQFKEIQTIYSLFNAFDLPNLEYASLICDRSYQTQIIQINIIQRKYLKYLSFKSEKDFLDDPEYRSIKNGILISSIFTILCEVKKV